MELSDICGNGWYSQQRSDADQDCLRSSLTARAFKDRKFLSPTPAVWVKRVCQPTGVTPLPWIPCFLNTSVQSQQYQQNLPLMWLFYQSIEYSAVEQPALWWEPTLQELKSEKTMYSNIHTSNIFHLGYKSKTSCTILWCQFGVTWSIRSRCDSKIL